MEVGQIIIDFDIFSHKPNQLVIGDNSDWVYAENLPAFILITIPGSRKPLTYTFKKNALNRFNSHNLGLSCLTADCQEEQYVDLPDGIYTVCVKSGYQGIENSKFHLKTDVFEQEFAKVMVLYGLEYKDEGKQFIFDMMFIDGILKVAKSHAMEGDFVKAQNFFEEAKELLRKRVNCKDCI